MSRSCDSPSQHGITATMARYLVVIHELASAQGTATVRGIAIVLDISNPSATNMIKRLRAKGLVADRETRAITLSDHGEHIARIQIERVGLVQRHLIDAFGYAPADARLEATRLAPAVSDLLVRRLESVVFANQEDRAQQFLNVRRFEPVFDVEGVANESFR
jgi:Mn-dependent DtxR family transcriptional regulator